MEEGRLPKEVMKWSPPGRRKRGRHKLTWAEGIRGLMGEKGLMEEDWNDRRRRNKIIVKWAQEDVETLYNLLNKKGKSVPLQAWSSPEGSRKLTLQTPSQISSAICWHY